MRTSRAIILGIVLLVTPFGAAVLAGETGNQAAAIAEGGRLYDKWWQEYGLRKPDMTHPAYPAAGKQRGATTWRCKECHGWDYRGRSGAYAQGSRHYTGIKGIRDYAGRPISEIVAVLKNSTHRYDEVMLDPALVLIAGFVANGQYKVSDFLEPGTSWASGDAELGKPVFQAKCLRCHGEHGTDINFGDRRDPEYIGTVASKNPWEALHKIKNGHPGSSMHHMIMHGNEQISVRHRQGLIKPRESMPYMRGDLTDQGIRDLLTYLQTLPVK